MMKKEYRVINNYDHLDRGNVHEYTINVEETKEGYERITLFTSSDPIWTDHHRNIKLFSIINTGDGYIFPKKTFSGEVGYDTAAELYILIQFINRESASCLFKGYIEEVILEKRIEL